MSESALPPPEESMRVSGPPPTGAGSPAHRSRRAALVLALVAVVVLATLGWRVSQTAREGWWASEPHVAVEPADGGGASHAGLTIALAELEPMGPITAYGETFAPPDGFSVWRVGLAITATNTEAVACDVYVQDERGRRYVAGRHVPSGVEGIDSYLRCRAPAADEEALPDVQRILVLLPDDAEPDHVRVQSSWGLNPYYYRLPVRP